MKLRYLTLLASAALLVSCNKEATPEVADNEMCFVVNHPSTKATEDSFEAGDKIGVYIVKHNENSNTKPILQLGGNYKNNNPVIYYGSEWKSEPIIYWDEGKFNIYAYYPYTYPDSVDEMSFSISQDQSIEDIGNGLSAFEASDFLFASKIGVTAEDGNVNLPFKHKMSKLTINLHKGEDFEGELPNNAKVLIHSTVIDCFIDLSNGDVVKDPNAIGKTIVAKQVSEQRHSAIIVPQMLTNRRPLIEVIYGEVSYLMESKFNFRSGMHHIIDVTINTNPEKVKIEVGGEIDNWGW